VSRRVWYWEGQFARGAPVLHVLYRPPTPSLEKKASSGFIELSVAREPFLGFRHTESGMKVHRHETGTRRPNARADSSRNRALVHDVGALELVERASALVPNPRSSHQKHSVILSEVAS
jgi:hypothetical protein